MRSDNNTTVMIEMQKRNKPFCNVLIPAQMRETYDDKMEERYVLPCGQDKPIEYWNATNLRQHLDECAACRVLIGVSDARVMNQDEIAALFERGIDGCKTGTDNLSSKDGILIHYGTIEAIRLFDGTVIENTQCWNAGFSSCPRMRGKNNVDLPLTTIDRLIIHRYEDIRSQLKVIDVDKEDNDDHVLFSVENTDGIKFYLYGRDEFRPFLVELPGRAGSVQDALELLKPAMVRDAIRAGLDVKRQGDIFFVPVPDATDKTVFGMERAHFEKQQVRDYRFNDSMEREDYIRENRVKVTPKIMNTNHTAQFLASYDHKLVVKGKIGHERRQHQKLDLGEIWHCALKNTGVQSWQVDRRSSGGSD